MTVIRFFSFRLAKETETDLRSASSLLTLRVEEKPQSHFDFYELCRITFFLSTFILSLLQEDNTDETQCVHLCDPPDNLFKDELAGHDVTDLSLPPDKDKPSVLNNDDNENMFIPSTSTDISSESATLPSVNTDTDDLCTESTLLHTGSSECEDKNSLDLYEESPKSSCEKIMDDINSDSESVLPLSKSRRLSDSSIFDPSRTIYSCVTTDVDMMDSEEQAKIDQKLGLSTINDISTSEENLDTNHSSERENEFENLSNNRLKDKNQSSLSCVLSVSENSVSYDEHSNTQSESVVYMPKRPYVSETDVPSQNEIFSTLHYTSTHSSYSPTISTQSRNHECVTTVTSTPLCSTSSISDDSHSISTKHSFNNYNAFTSNSLGETENLHVYSDNTPDSYHTTSPIKSTSAIQCLRRSDLQTHSKEYEFVQPYHPLPSTEVSDELDAQNYSLVDSSYIQGSHIPSDVSSYKQCLDGDGSEYLEDDELGPGKRISDDYQSYDASMQVNQYVPSTSNEPESNGQLQEVCIQDLSLENEQNPTTLGNESERPYFSAAEDVISTSNSTSAYICTSVTDSAAIEVTNDPNSTTDSNELALVPYVPVSSPTLISDGVIDNNEGAMRTGDQDFKNGAKTTSFSQPSSVGAPSYKGSTLVQGMNVNMNVYLFLYFYTSHIFCVLNVWQERALYFVLLAFFIFFHFYSCCFRDIFCPPFTSFYLDNSQYMQVAGWAFHPL